jgi:hypothetical protein
MEGDDVRPGSHEKGRLLDRSGLRVLAAAFPVILLVFATTFQLGGTGFWADDYWLNQRDILTGQLPPLLEEGRLTHSTLIINRGFFLRPLFYTIAPPLVTLTWEADWLAHGVLILSHSAVVLLLYRLMLRLGLARQPAAAASLLFMVYPMQYEVLYWAAAAPITLSALLMLVIFHMHAGLAARSLRGEGLGRAWPTWAMLLLLPLLGFAACSLNEQPAAGVVAMPLLYLSARRAASAAGDTGRPRLSRDPFWLFPAALAASGIVAYLLLMKFGLPPLIRPVPEGVRGAADSLVRPGELPRRIEQVARSVRDTMWRSQFARGALIQGVRELRAAPLSAAVFAFLLASSGAVWAARWVRQDAQRESASPSQPGTGVRAVLLGAAVFVGGFVPIVVVTVYIAAPRIMYWPAIGAAIMVAGAGSAMAMRVRAAERGGARSAIPRLVVAVLLAVLLMWSVLLIGVAASFRNRWVQDWSEGHQLRALVPDPVPGACFIPLRLQSACAATGQWRFDRHLQTVFAWPWTAPRFIRMVYAREDVTSGSWRPWAQHAQSADENGILYTGHLDGVSSEGGRILWDRAIPFVVTPDGRVRLVTTLILTEDGRPDTRLDVPLNRPGPALEIEPYEFRLPRG